MQALKKFGFIPALLLPCQLLMAQAVPIVEAGGASRQQAAQPPANNNQNEIVVNMYLQLEALQQEVQNLRGLVEEQAYTIRRMQTEQRDRYLDTDSRIVELQNSLEGNRTPGGQPLTQAPGTTGNTPGAQGVTGPANSPGSQAVAGGTPAQASGTNTVSSPQSEQEVYRQALALLLEDEAYADSITLFQQYIDVYPQGRYFTNALYWQGAALELAGNYNRAIDVLQRLIDNYPQDAKAPTAMLRLGTVYREMGRTDEAITLWRQIREQYPDSTSEIEIANEYLSDAGSF